MKMFRNRIILLMAVAIQNVALAVQVETLVDFNSMNGDAPEAGLVRDIQGNFYGTTYIGGFNDDGTVFRLTPPKGQTTWSLTTLLDFNNTNGARPSSNLIRDTKGNLYGTTTQGGAHNLGVVFKLSPPPKGQIAWTQTTLQEFNGTNGAYPSANLIRDVKGNLYGT
ncbi:MAG: hypothetical protein HOO92_13665, partial [Methylococcaceae bacterium]|nr:hypothetical protein [Methylococcaceae bacterium]